MREHSPKTLLLEKAHNSQSKRVNEQLVWSQGKCNNVGAWMENETDCHKITVKVNSNKKLGCFQEVYVYPERRYSLFPLFWDLDMKDSKVMLLSVFPF